MATRPCLPRAQVQVQERPQHSSCNGFVRVLAVSSPRKWSRICVRNESWFPAPSTIPRSHARSTRPGRPGLFFLATKAPSTRISLMPKLSFLWCTLVLEFIHCPLSRRSLVCPRAIQFPRILITKNTCKIRKERNTPPSLRPEGTRGRRRDGARGTGGGEDLQNPLWVAGARHRASLWLSEPSTPPSRVPLMEMTHSYLKLQLRFPVSFNKYLMGS